MEVQNKPYLEVIKVLKVDQVHLIRHKILVENQSIRAVAKQVGVSRNTIRKYLDEPTPKPKPRKPKIAPVREAVLPRLTAIVEQWQPRTTAKQRLTIRRLHQQLRSEGFDVGITTVRNLVAERKRLQKETYIPLTYRPGDVAQVDFFEVAVDINGQRRKVWKFVMRLMYSGRDFAWLSERADQLAFLDGHVRAFEHFGGVPQRIVYDNLKAAVQKVLVTGRELTPRFKALCCHYAFEPSFARPGQGHDKGGVEARGKGIRLQHLTPIRRGKT